MKNLLITLTGISGSGKSTVLRKLEEDYDFHKVITCTTREPRIADNEVDKVDYFFLSKENFENEVKNNKFVENEKFDGNYYGTRWSEIENKKTIPIAILEPNGAKNIKKILKDENYEVINVFIDCPPELAIERITRRDSSIPERLEKRLESIRTKEANWHTRDYDLKVLPDGNIKLINQQIVDKIIEFRKKESLENKPKKIKKTVK
jgi:guanylate kinase